MSKILHSAPESPQDPCGLWAKTDATSAVDLENLRVLAGLSEEGGPDLIIELIDLYLGEGPTRLEGLRLACENQDAITLKNSAHNLKGSSGNLGAMKLADICEQLERLALKESFTEATELLSVLEYEYGRVQRVLLAERETRC
ncbi:MAG TPA: Hpt domain-containing protein [Pyrinomonadaceae bacterium]|jgi:HPt (histidine-containing phosphotransfer) domain-containing protein